MLVKEVFDVVTANLLLEIFLIFTILHHLSGMWAVRQDVLSLENKK